MLELQLAELERVAHDPDKEAVSNAITALPQFIAVAKAAQENHQYYQEHRNASPNALYALLDRKHREMDALLSGLSAALPSAKEDSRELSK